MTPYRKCGSDSYITTTGKGCKKYFNIVNLQRCWHCGILFCSDCFSIHDATNRIALAEGFIKRGGEKQSK